MRRRTKGRAIRSTPIFWQCTGHRHRGGEDASNRAIPWWGGRRWRPYRNRRRVACSNETARRVAERPRRRCPFLLVCSRVYGAFIVENPQSIGLNGERNLANASQLQLRLLSFTTTSPPHNGFSSVVYVILLFHIVRSSFFNRHPHRSSSWNRVTRGIFRGFLGWIWFFDPSFYFFSTCTHSSFKKNVIWIGNDNWWCTNLKIKSKMWDKNYIRMEIIGSWTTKIINIFVRDIWFLFPRRNYLCSNLVNERIEEKLLSVFISR